MPSYPALSPSIDRSRAPPYWEMNDHPKRFEKLSAALLYGEAGVVRAALYRVNGARQHGIDVWAKRLDGGLDVVSCKCVRSVKPAQLKTWSKDFLSHWDNRWGPRQVRRFILAIAAENITDEKVELAIEQEAARFEALGVDYEIWAIDDLTHRLRSRREIAYQYLDDHWTTLICGGPAAASADPDLTAQLTAEIHALGALLSGRVDHAASAAIDAVRRGQHGAAKTLIADLEHEASLPTAAKARVLRLAATIALQEGRVEDAERVCAQAEALAPTAEPRLQAHIALRRSGARDALAVLGQPVSLEGRQAKAGFLIEAGDPAAAAKVLEALAEAAPADAETHRLLAIAYLADGRRDLALAAADRAEALAPEWVSVIRGAAMVRYALALSPSVPQEWIFYPNPIDAALVKEDDVARRRLEEALVRFSRLVQRPGGERLDRVWRMACLAALGDRKGETEAACGALLADDPIDLDALGWAHVHELGVDFESAIVALGRLYEDGFADVAAVSLYAWLLLAHRGPDHAAAALRAGLAVQHAEARAEAEGWIAAFASGEPGPLDLTGGVVGMALEQHLAKAEATGDWQALEAELDRRLSETPPHPLGLKLAEAFAGAGREAALARHQQALLAYEVGRGVEVAAFVVRRTEPANLLGFLEANRSAFRDGKLPEDLRRLEIEAQIRDRQIITALDKVRDLATETRSPLDRQYEAKIHLMRGDAVAAQPIVSELLAARSIPALDAVQYSLAFTRTAPQLARDLVRHAIDTGVTDAALPLLYDQVRHMGLDAEMAALTPHLDEAAERPNGPVQKISAEDIKAAREQARAVKASIVEPYEAGAAAVHMAAPAFGVSLAELYRLDRTAQDQGPLRHLFLRHGGRSIDLGDGLAWRELTYHLDLTALLIADQLDLLRLLEGLGRPILISASVLDALFLLERDTQKGHAAFLRAAADIVLVQSRLRIADGQEPERATVRDRRDRRRGDLAGPTPASIVDWLAAVGEIAPEAIEGLSSRFGQSAPVDPPADGILLFGGDCLIALTAAGLLPALLARFECRVEPGFIEAVTAVHAGARDRDRLGDRLTALRQRIAAGIGKHYALAPRCADFDRPEGPPPDPFEQGLMDMIAAPAGPQTVVWVDDRFVSGFNTTDGALVIGVVEILNAMTAAGDLTEEARHGKLQQLRAAGALFIPIDPQEVLVELCKAPVVGGAVIETAGLRLLRRYLALALGQDARLHVGRTPHDSIRDQPEETEFLKASRRLVDDVLVATWSDPSLSIEACMARSDWLWANLRVEQFVRPFNPAGAAAFPALLVAALLTAPHAICLETPEATLERRRAYFDWLEMAVLTPRAILGNSAFFARLAGHVRDLLLGTMARRSDLSDGVDPDQVRAALRGLTSLLPGSVRDRLIEDRAFVEGLDLPTVRYMVCVDRRFPAEMFWDGLRRALRQGETVLSDENGEQITFRRDREGVSMATAPPTYVTSPLFKMARADERDLLALARPYFDELDLGPQDRDRLLSEIAGAELWADRIAALNEGARLSIIEGLAGIAETLRTREPAGVSLFKPPTFSRLLHYVRRDPSRVQPLAERWAALEAKIGPLHAFRRLQGAPVLLADVVAPGIKGKAGRDAAKQIFDAAQTPLGVLQAAALAKRLGRAKAAKTLVKRFVYAVERHGAHFIAVLRWLERELESDPEWARAEASLRFEALWAYADRLLEVQIAHNVWGEKAVAFFEENLASSPLSMVLTRQADYVLDCACPEILSVEALLYHGLAVLHGEGLKPTDLGEPLALKVFSRLVLVRGESLVPASGLLLRGPHLQNSLNGFLTRAPKGLFDEEAMPQARRKLEIDAALERLEADPSAEAAWATLAALGRPAFTADHGQRFNALFETIDLWILDQASPGAKAARVAVETQVRSAPRLEPLVLEAKLGAYATAARARYPGPLREGGPASAAFDELLEMAAAIARGPDGAQALAQFAGLAVSLARTWPESAPSWRTVFDALVRRSDPAESRVLWRGHLDLRALP
ncbi:hypothetical protein [Caulobacter sp.]|uniref:hypothetical protein n=1 Tax=Caulobacter sp. TaxID=78 RepID=UPI0031D6BEC5